MALSANTPQKFEVGLFNEIPVAATTTVYEGSMVGLAAGYGRALTAGDAFVGHAMAKADNSTGDAADIDVHVRTGIYRAEVTLTSVAVTDVGKEVFASDDATYTLTRGENTCVGRVVRYVTTNTCVVEFAPELAPLANGVVVGVATEIDCQTTIDTGAHVLVPAWMNPRGLVIESIYGRLTEAMAGDTEDQGVITVYDESDNSLAVLTPSNGGTDAIGDIVVGYLADAASTGAAHKVVAAGEFIDCKVTQATSGASVAGKMVVYIKAVPLI